MGSHRRDDTPMENSSRKYPEGHFVGMWMAIGVAIGSGLGVPLSFAIDNPAFLGVGSAIGFSIGLVIGSSVEAKHKKLGELRPLTTAEKRKQKLSLISGVLLLVMGVVAFLVFALV